MNRIAQHRQLVIVGILALALVAGGACSSETPQEVEGIAPTPTPGDVPTATPLTVTDQDYTPPEDQHWISPGTVAIGNFHPGARAEWNLTVHNGNTEPTEFTLSVQQPQKTKAGYEPASQEALDWVIISEPAPVLAGRETRDILIAVEMPEGCAGPEHWEFWIVCKPDARGFVQVQYASRWLVDMR